MLSTTTPALAVIAPAKVTPVVPVGIDITSASASFFIVTSFVEP